MKKSHIIEKMIEHGLFASRWFMAPFYVGLAIALGGLTYNFMLELWHFICQIPSATSTDVILGALSLIDLSLAGNLILIVIFSGYENFVSKLDVTNHKYQPDWKGSVDFNTLKLKLISSIVAISGIHLLKIFMSDAPINAVSFRWLLMTHLVFLLSGVLLASMDFISAHTQAKKGKKKESGSAEVSCEQRQ